MTLLTSSVLVAGGSADDAVIKPVAGRFELWNSEVPVPKAAELLPLNRNSAELAIIPIESLQAE
jgi:hypothetical protein